MKNLKDKMYKGMAVATMAALPAIAFANDAGIADAAKTELGSLKTAIIAIGAVVIGLAVAAVSIGVVKRAINKA